VCVCLCREVLRKRDTKFARDCVRERYCALVCLFFCDCVWERHSVSETHTHKHTLMQREKERVCVFSCVRPGLNFINVLRTAFMLADPKSVKKTVKLSIFFMLLGSTSVKAVSRTLMKLSPGWMSSTFSVQLDHT